ncbi:hypothetical protein K3495_g1722 [Podosphaera aphanis]|nr:hypothetical protein K3495_g1722 [Podosphaera aphanis]
MSYATSLSFIFAGSSYALPATITTATQALPSITSLPISKSNNKNANSSINYHLLFLAVAGTLFCAVSIFIQRRRKRKLDLATQNTTDLVRHSTAERRIRNTSVELGEECQPARERDEALEGLNEQGEAPPPYAPGIKPPSLTDIELSQHIDDTSTQRTTSDPLPPPAYNEDISNSHPVTHEETEITQPAPAMTTERSGSMVHSLIIMDGRYL